MALHELNEQLRLDRCPFCGVDRPNLPKMYEAYTSNSEGSGKRFWRFYACARCGGVITATAEKPGNYAEKIFPTTLSAAREMPERARAYLDQALQSIHAPAGAIMLAASSVDAMLKTKGYIEGNLYSRIEKAAKDNLITDGMSKWAHQVRLEANDQRHADESAALPTEKEAQRVIHFVKALAEFLFVLPAMVEAGIQESAPGPQT